MCSQYFQNSYMLGPHPWEAGSIGLGGSIGIFNSSRDDSDAYPPVENHHRATEDKNSLRLRQEDGLSLFKAQPHH